MRDDVAPGMQCFVGVGLLMVAWYIAPGLHSDPMLYLLSGMFAVCGAAMLITGFRRAQPSPSPLPGFAGSVIWAFRPRSWMTAWAAIYMLASIYGTPHLAFNYPPRTPIGVCEYLGWRGSVQVTGKPGGMLNGCAMVILR